MSDDLLERASRALRKEGEPTEEAVQRNRARVLDSMRTEKRRRTRLFYVAFPIAAVLVGTTAWAASTGRLRALWPASKQDPPVAVAPPPPHVEPPPPHYAPPPPHYAPPPPPEPEPPPVEAPKSAPVPRPPVAPSAPVEDASSTDLALYQVAHKLHFNDKNYAAAIGAWDEYLRGSPSGAFVVEARYNRAICLLKLGRKAEAKVALQPFADGKVAGGYRQEEAQRLLERLASE
jgi:hypothetical protein